MNGSVTPTNTADAGGLPKKTRKKYTAEERKTWQSSKRMKEVYIGAERWNAVRWVETQPVRYTCAVGITTA